MKTWAVVSARSSGLGGDAKIVGRPVAEDRALGGHQLFDHPVERLVGPEGFAEPEIEREHSLRAQLLGVDAEHVAPLERPVIDVLGAVENSIDQFGSLVGILIGDEILDLVRRGRGSDRIEHRAAEEFGVGARG